MDYRNQICKQNNHEERIKELEEEIERLEKVVEDTGGKN